MQTLFENLKSRNDKPSFYKQKRTEALESDCKHFLKSVSYSSNPHVTLKKFEKNIAKIPKLLKKGDNHYKNKRFEESLEFHPKTLNECKLVDEKWTSNEKGAFSLSKRLKNRLRNKSNSQKTVHEMVEYYYMFHLPKLKKKRTNVRSKNPTTNEKTKVQNSKLKRKRSASDRKEGSTIKCLGKKQK